MFAITRVVTELDLTSACVSEFIILIFSINKPWERRSVFGLLDIGDQKRLWNYQSRSAFIVSNNLVLSNKTGIPEDT